MRIPVLLALLAALMLPVLSFAVTAEEYYQAALALYKQKDYEQAFKYYQAAAQTDPKHWKAYQSMGHCRYRQDRPGEALAYYEKSLALNPENPGLKQVADSLIASGVTAPAITPPPPATAPAESQSQSPNNSVTETTSSERGIPLSVNAPPDLGRARHGFGFKGGMNWSKLTGKDAANVTTGTGFAGSLFCWMELTPRVQVQPEIQVLQKKHSWSETTEESLPYPGGVQVVTWASEASVNTLFVEVPILVRFLAATQTPRVHFFAGPVVGAVLSAKQKGELKTTVNDIPDFGPILTSKTTESLDGDLKPFTRTVSVGAAGGMEVGIADFVLDVRYTMGLTATFKASDAKYATLTVMAGYSF